MLKFLAGVAGGLLFASLGSLLLGLMTDAAPAYMFLALWIAGVTVAMTADSAAKAWRKLLLSSAVFSFLAPLAGIVFTGSMIATHGDSAGAGSAGYTAGMAIGGGLLSGFLGFVGFFFGIVLLIVGLLVGRDKQVVYIERSQVEQPNSGVSDE